MNRSFVIEAGIVLGLSLAGCKAVDAQNQPQAKPVPEAPTASGLTPAQLRHLPLFSSTQVKPGPSPIPVPLYRGDAASYYTEFKARPCEINVTQNDGHGTTDAITLEGQMTTSQLFQPSDRFPGDYNGYPTYGVSYQFARRTVCANGKPSGELFITEPLNDDTGSQFPKDEAGNTLIPLRNPASSDNKGAFNTNYDFLNNAVFPTGPVECKVMPVPGSDLARIVCTP